jgi:hypothetical protein
MRLLTDLPEDNPLLGFQEYGDTDKAVIASSLS